MTVKLGVIGAGAVGSTLGGKLANSGRYQVKYASRDPASDKMKALISSQPGTTADTIPATAEWAEVLILATPSWDPAKQREQIKAMAASLGPGVKGKVLIDVINGLDSWPSLSLE